MNTSNLEKCFSHEKPFGPTNAANIEDDQSFKRLLDPHNKIIDRFKYNPSLIVGRRGSGKTSFLRGTAKYKVIELINTANTFAEIVSIINDRAQEFIFVEKISALWEQIFVLSLFRNIANQFKEPSRDIGIIKDYCAKYGLSNNISIEDWLWKLLKAARDKTKNEVISSVAAVIADIAGEDFESTKSASIKALQYNKSKAIILIDSLEQYPVRISNVALAISGLLLCAGEFNERNESIHIRLCLPAEMYHDFIDLSPNPVKNFSNSITLHWHSSELLGIAANRLNLYLSIYYPNSRREPDIIDNKNAVSFLKLFLPDEIINGYGNKEDTIAYILRHTQLMPRHVLKILNSIFSEAYRLKLNTYPVVDNQSVVRGIRKTEVNLAEEVCSAFKVRYPKLRNTCEACIKYLTYVFKEGDLHEVFNKHGRKSSGFEDFEDFKRMLIESAVIGRVVSSKQERYVNGLFEYTAAHKLITSTNDSLCLHPIFAEVFNFLRTEEAKPIYPFGTDPDSEDYRDQLLWTS